MSEPKRYFWLKLHKDFFKRKEIKRLRKIAGGDTYTIIYLEMMLRSIMDDGKLFFDGLEDDFASELALDLDEDEENVKITIQYLLKTGLLEIRSDEEYYLPDTKDSTGCETAVAARVRKHREKQKALQCNIDVTQVKHLCNGEIETEIEKEIELDKIHCHAEHDHISKPIIEIIDYLNLKTGKSYKNTTKKTQSLIKARLNEHFTVDDFKKVIDNMCAKWIGTKWEEFLRPNTLFAGKFDDYLNQTQTKSETRERIDNVNALLKQYEEEERRTNEQG